MRIIIAIDILGGKCVRLTRGDFNTKKIYNEDPLEMALKIEANGIKYLHLVDLDGAKTGKWQHDGRPMQHCDLCNRKVLDCKAG
jgi:phosphoribosylformimino-5-aminoimidazole carboxamide ribotide isomerase